MLIVRFRSSLKTALAANLVQCLAFIFVLTAASVSALGSTVYITLDSNFPTDYLSYTYTDSSGTYTVPSGPYPATLSGGSYVDGQTYYVWCYDINVDSYAGEQYSGSLDAPTTAEEIESAYLEDQIIQLYGYPTAPASEDTTYATETGAYSMAIWQLMDPSSYNPAAFPEDPAAQALITQAQTAYQNGTWTQADADNYTIWVPDDPSSSQRFGLIAINSSVPEPASYLLIGAGLVGLTAIRRKR